MAAHSYSIFKNLCVKTPVNPENRLPLAHYERMKSAQSIPEPQTNDVIKIFENLSFNDEDESTENVKVMENKGNNRSGIVNTNSLMNFYESIPDYRDINHLSEKDFYSKIDLLKNKQQELKNYYNSGRNSNKNLKNSEDNKKIPYLNSIITSRKFRDYYNKTPPVRFKISNEDDVDEGDYDCGSDADEHDSQANNCNRKSFLKSLKMNHKKSFLNYDDDDDYGVCCNYSKYNNRSKSASPLRQSYSPKLLTVPKPFKMTQREEEERMLDDLMVSSKVSTPKEKKKTDTKPFKANPVPITSKIPMMKYIMAEQDHKNELARLSSTIELQTQMKPFSFTENKTDRRPNTRCLSRSTSSPNLSITNKRKMFKAKPCPSNLFSNYFYHKLWEDEYFRSLNRKIRAEELLKSAALPPSMAKRETKSATVKCKRDLLRCENSSQGSGKRLHKKRKKFKRRNSKSDFNKIAQYNNQFITTGTRPFEFETEKRARKRFNKQPSTETSSPTNSIYRSSPMPVYPVSRPNLAATLRVQHSRQKMYKMSNNTDSDIVSPRKIKPKRIDWGVKKSPAWKSIYFDGTNDDDIYVRLATRRAEQKLRQQEHEFNMELMKQRVRAAPLLLEGPTHWGPRVGKQSHSCGREAQEKLAQKLKRRPQSYCHHKPRNVSKLSYYSDGKHSIKSSARSKKEAISEFNNYRDFEELDSVDAAVL